MASATLFFRFFVTVSLCSCGASPKEKALEAFASKNKNNYLGMWSRFDPGNDEVFIIKNDHKDGWVFGQAPSVLAIDSPFLLRLQLAIDHGKKIYRVCENEGGRFFMVKPNGDLSEYDNDGFVTTYKKVP